jgi:hypothetical protein
MTKWKVLTMVVFLFLFAVTISSIAKAQTYNKKTIVTFNNPVEVPGVGEHVLPAGTYVFRIVDSVSNRDIVQIFNEEETHVFTTILAIANYRLKPTSKTVLTFNERPAGTPEALKAWFYPGETFGQEFVYPKAQAIQLAKEVNEPVLTMPSELAREITPPEAPAPEPPPVEALKEAPVAAVEPSGKEVEIAQVVTPPMLPETASFAPLIVLFGMLSLTLGFALWFFRKSLPKPRTCPARNN